jgi:hypothetical protein
MDYFMFIQRGFFTGYSQFIYPQNSYLHLLCNRIHWVLVILKQGIVLKALWLSCSHWQSGTNRYYWHSHQKQEVSYQELERQSWIG